MTIENVLNAIGVGIIAYLALEGFIGYCLAKDKLVETITPDEERDIDTLCKVVGIIVILISIH